jgi:hypothetical protein
VRDEEQRQPELRSHVAQQIQDVRLDADVQGRRRLVGDQQRWTARQRHGDEDALQLPARTADAGNRARDA